MDHHDNRNGAAHHNQPQLEERMTAVYDMAKANNQGWDNRECFRPRQIDPVDAAAQHSLRRKPGMNFNSGKFTSHRSLAEASYRRESVASRRSSIAASIEKCLASIRRKLSDRLKRMSDTAADSLTKVKTEPPPPPRGPLIHRVASRRPVEMAFAPGSRRPRGFTVEGDSRCGRFDLFDATQHIIELAFRGEPVGEAVRSHFPRSIRHDAQPLSCCEAEFVGGTSKVPVCFAKYVGDYCCLCKAITRHKLTESYLRAGKRCGSGCVSHDWGACDCTEVFAWCRPQYLGPAFREANFYCLSWLCCRCQGANMVQELGQQPGQESCIDCHHKRCCICAIETPGGFSIALETDALRHQHRSDDSTCHRS